MKKPSHQWETRLHRARRLDSVVAPELAGDARAESFALEFEDRVGELTCALERQLVDEESADDPDLAHAVGAWLVARGQRRINLCTSAGRSIAQGQVSAAELSDPRPAEAPGCLISLCPSNAEMLDALAVFDRVVACEESSDYPPEVAHLERLGPDLSPDLNRVAELKPDLVLSSLSVPGMERVVTGLRARGVPQLVLAPRSLDDVCEEMTLLGEYLGESGAGVRARAAFELERAELKAELRGEAVPVFLEWWPRPMFTPGSDCYSNELLELAGAVNVFRDRPGSSVQIETEALLAAAPEICFLSWCGVEESKLDPRRLIEREGLEDLEAARAGRVYPLDERFSGRPGPRMLEAARRMAVHVRARREGKS